VVFVVSEVCSLVHKDPWMRMSPVKMVFAVSEARLVHKHPLMRMSPVKVVVTTALQMVDWLVCPLVLVMKQY